ncbi:MAG: hypothetical protein GQ527_05575 [Bacteroidales bacterium]|nr:hypothetical protein [Bacteroidales bacterium]
MGNNPNILASFFRYNMVAILATTVDFLAFILLNDIINLWYVASTFISAIIGGTVAFILNRNWVFKSKNGKPSFQVVKYIVVWGGSILLNTYGLYLIVENTNISEMLSKVLVSVFIGVSYNFLMSKFIIFK